jgi:hypothetical protein
MSATANRTRKPKARNLLAVDAHFRKAGAIEPSKGKLPRKVKHKKHKDSDN